MPSTDYLTYAYAALVASGGVLGYVKKGKYWHYCWICCKVDYVTSVMIRKWFFIEICAIFLGSIPSLAAGLAFGAVIGLGAYHTSQNPNRYYVALGASAALTVFMGKRFLSGGKFMPAGLVACVRYVLKSLHIKWICYINSHFNFAAF